MDIPLLFHDKCIAVCLKPPGADSEKDMPALLSRQLAAAEVFCVHRLDRDVGGVMVYALNAKSAAALTAQMGGGGFEKQYLAVTHDRPEKDADTLRDLLFHDRTNNKSFVVKRKRAGVREAVLDYRVLAEAEGFALLSIQLHTGRTHQIRVQLAARRHPLVGDAKYGSPRRDCTIALFSRALGFAHPVSGETLRFAAPPPDAFPWNMFDMEEVSIHSGVSS